MVLDHRKFDKYLLINLLVKNLLIFYGYRLRDLPHSPVMAKAKYSIPTDQNFWQLASIQAVSIGLPTIMIGGRLTAEFGTATTIASILVGNLIIWLTGLAIIAMSVDRRNHSIENVREFLGKWGSIAGAMILLFAFILWIALQLEVSVSILARAWEDYLPNGPNLTVRLGSVLGILTALIAIGGIRWIKWLCTAFLPLFLLYLVYALVAYGHETPLSLKWQPSLLAVVSTIAINLPGIINLPTFFRHARSKPHAFLALTAIFLLYTLLECSSIWLSIGNISADLAIRDSWQLIEILTTTFMAVFLLICANLVNIYFASAGWETIIPMQRTAREYVIVGLAGTMLFVFIQDAVWTLLLENLFVGFIGCMGVALVASYVIKIVASTHRVRPFEKITASVCWGIGCLVVLLYQLNWKVSAAQSLAAGVSTTAITTLIFIFIEETVWSISKILDTRRL